MLEGLVVYVCVLLFRELPNIGSFHYSHETHLHCDLDLDFSAADFFEALEVSVCSSRSTCPNIWKIQSFRTMDIKRFSDIVAS